MLALRPWIIALAAGVAGCAGTPPPPDAQSLLRQAETALGSAGVKTLRFTAVGTGATFGQAYQATGAWPALNYSTLTRVMDFDAGAYSEDYARSRGEPTGGGATPLMGTGEQKATGFLRDGYAWNGGATPAPAPVALDARTHDLWTGTPHGAIKAAQRYNASAGTRVVDGQTLNTLSYSVPGRFSAVVLVDKNGLVSAVESTLPNPVLGDTDVVTRFSDYNDVAGVKFPLRIRQSQGGHPVLDVSVKEVRTNGSVEFGLPDNVRTAKENAAVSKAADGVWFIGGGSHNSVAIELSDQIVLVESPLYDGRAEAVFAAANQLVPGKTVRTVINSHHHFDHAGGLRFAVGSGATLVASAAAKPYLERAFANPNRIAPDLLSRSGRTPTIVGVNGKHVIADRLRTVEVHEIQDSVHAQGFLIVYLPREKLLIEADAYTPGAPNSPTPAVPNGNNVNLVQNLDRLGLQVERILPLHGRIVPLGELYNAIGRRS